MAAPLILYSTNTWLAFQVCERYYRGAHYVWCTPFFNAAWEPIAPRFAPPTSSPWEIYRSLHSECRAGDRHSSKIDQNRVGILNGATARLHAGIISESDERNIVSTVELAETRDFQPLLYVIPYAKVSRLLEEVPVKDRAHPLAHEYKIESLPRKYFDVIRLEL